MEIYGGNIATGSGSGLLVTGGNTTIRGLSITGFRGNGIELRSGGGNRIECSYVGVAPDGVTAKGNGVNGIQIVDSAANVVGGPSPIVRNVISGNTGEGVKIDGAPSTGNVIEGNYVGTDAAGSAALGNAASGIYIRRAPGNSIVGNVVSGNNGFAGIAICGNADFCGGANDGTPGSNASGNIVNANRWARMPTGLAPLANAGIGVDHRQRAEHHGRWHRRGQCDYVERGRGAVCSDRSRPATGSCRTASTTTAPSASASALTWAAAG